MMTHCADVLILERLTGPYILRCRLVSDVPGSSDFNGEECSHRYIEMGMGMYLYSHRDIRIDT